MKHIYLLLIAVFVLQTAQSQIVNIPDANFKNELIEDGVDISGDGEIQVNEAEAITFLDVSGQSIASVEGISAFINLEQFTCVQNEITTLDLSGLTNLYYIECGYNQLTNINVSGIGKLRHFYFNNNLITTLNNVIGFTTNTYEDLIELNCSNNQLTSINVSDLPSNVNYLFCKNNSLESLDLSTSLNLAQLDCSNNPLTSLTLPENPINFSVLGCTNTNLTSIDLGSSSDLYRIDLYNNSELEYINIKNGKVCNDSNYCFYFFDNNPKLSYICVDSENLSLVQDLVDSYGYTNCVVNSYCSFVPGGEFFTIQGETKLDLNSNGCDVNDENYPNLKFDITDGSNSGSVLSDASGSYRIPVLEDTHTITPILENTSYFTISPSSVSVTFPTDSSPFTQDFCITPNGSYNDLEVSVLPIDQARPGFDTRYKIFYKNKGTTTLSGMVDLTFDDDLMNLVSANPIVDSQTIDYLSWNYTNLMPFESGEIVVTMNLNTPTDTPPLNGNDRLDYVVTANPVAGDETMSDNTSQLKQTVVNSYDPNDKTCLEGNTITPDLIGEYVNYLIRFENTGTADAINVVVKDMIDTAKFDVSTLFLTDSSHDLVTRISGNKIEFIFENINLPFDDANNDGYLAFKIKTLNILIEGDTFENDAEIYFDYNFPIQTNVALTSIQSPLSIDNFELSGFEIYPNPSQDKLFINGLDAIKSVTIYDISGRLINEVSLIGTRNNIEISTEKLGQGAYFVKIKTNVSEFVKKVVKD